MKIIKGDIVFTDSEIKLLEEQNPTMFAVMVWINKYIPGAFASHNNPIDENFKFDGQISFLGHWCCLTPFCEYASRDYCFGLDCWCIGDEWTSCLEQTWLEFTGKKEMIYRHKNYDIEQRKFLLKRMVVEQKGIRVV